MKRVRFLEHVMGLDDGPEACRLEGEVAWVSDDVYDFLARQRTRVENRPWILDVDDHARTVECKWCKREFWPTAIPEHRRFFHVEAPTHVGPKPEPEHECWCGEKFGTEHGMRVHQGRMHKETRSGTGPP